MTLSNGKGVCLPEAPTLANVIQAEGIIGAGDIGENIIWIVISQHSYTGATSGELTILKILWPREGPALDHSKFDLLKWFPLDAGTFGQPFLGLLEDLTLRGISKER